MTMDRIFFLCYVCLCFATTHCVYFVVVLELVICKQMLVREKFELSLCNRWARVLLVDEIFSPFRILSPTHLCPKECQGDVPTSHDCAVSSYDSQGNGVLCC